MPTNQSKIFQSTKRGLLERSKTATENWFISSSMTYISISFTFLFLSLVTTYVLNQYLLIPIDARLLYFANDPGWVAEGGTDSPILGTHYFGDYLTTISWSKLENPFLSSSEFPSTYAPLLILLLKPFAGISPLIGLVVWDVLTVGLITFVLSRFLKKYPWQFQITILLSALFLTRPFLLLLDRGNVQGLVFILMAFAIFSLVKGSKNLWVAEICIAAAASLKYYPILLILLFLQKQNLHRIIRVTVMTFIGIVVPLFVVTGGNFYDGVKGLIKGLSVQGLYPISGSSGSAWILRIASKTNIVNDQNVQILLSKWISAGILISGITAISIAVYRNYFTKTQTIIAILALTTIGIPVSWGYNLIWASLAVILLMTESDWKSDNRIDTAILLGFIPVLGLIPWVSSHTNVVNTGVSEYWTFPFIFAVTMYWFVRGIYRKDLLIG